MIFNKKEQFASGNYFMKKTKKHHSVKLKEIVYAKLGKEHNSFISFISEEVANIDTIIDFAVVYVKRGVIFRKKVLTLFLLLKSSNAKEVIVKNIEFQLKKYLTDKDFFIDFIILSDAVKHEKETFYNIKC